jgi:hypothetical protein
MATYYRPPTNIDGTRMTFAQRQAARAAADSERQKKSESPARDPIYDLPFAERQAIREAEQRGREEARRLAAIEETAAKQAAIDATPEHLRRPENTFRKTIEMLRPTAYRPGVARRIKEYEQRAEERDREIEIEMAEKLHRYEGKKAPEAKPARAHWERASAAAETA